MRTTTKSGQPILPRPGANKDIDGNVLAQLLALKKLSVNELKTKWLQLFGDGAPNNARAFLEARIGYRLQELVYGGPTPETKRVLDLLADEVEGKVTRKSMMADPRNPMPGTKLVREWDGVEHNVTVLGDGFEWQGRKYKSLSAVAKSITGTSWSGYRFFGLQETRRGAK